MISQNDLRKIALLFQCFLPDSGFFSTILPVYPGQTYRANEQDFRVGRTVTQLSRSFHLIPKSLPFGNIIR